VALEAGRSSKTEIELGTPGITGKRILQKLLFHGSGREAEGSLNRQREKILYYDCLTLRLDPEERRKEE
jgi:hypothetical protein